MTFDKQKIDNTYNNKTPPSIATDMIARIAISISSVLETSDVVWNILIN